MRSIIIPILFIFVGCSSMPTTIWRKDYASEIEFKKDHVECQALLGQTGYGDKKERKSFIDECLEGRGWKICDPNPPSPAILWCFKWAFLEKCIQDEEKCREHIDCHRKDNLENLKQYYGCQRKD